MRAESEWTDGRAWAGCRALERVCPLGAGERARCEAGKRARGCWGRGRAALGHLTGWVAGSACAERVSTRGTGRARAMLMLASWDHRQERGTRRVERPECAGEGATVLGWEAN